MSAFGPWRPTDDYPVKFKLHKETMDKHRDRAEFDQFHTGAMDKLREIEQNKEKLLVAWIAEHGYKPGESIVVTKLQTDGSIRMWVEKRTEHDKYSDLMKDVPAEEREASGIDDLPEIPDRKGEPVYSGVLQYFPRAMRAISRVSKAGNDKHNPGQPLHWAHDKSYDQPDAAARHMLTPYDTDPDTNELHLAHAAWRVLAWLEMTLWAIEEDHGNLVGDFKAIGEFMADEYK